MTAAAANPISIDEGVTENPSTPAGRGGGGSAQPPGAQR